MKARPSDIMLMAMFGVAIFASLAILIAVSGQQPMATSGVGNSDNLPSAVPTGITLPEPVETAHAQATRRAALDVPPASTATPRVQRPGPRVIREAASVEPVFWTMEDTGLHQFKSKDGE